LVMVSLRIKNSDLHEKALMLADSAHFNRESFIYQAAEGT